MAAITRASATIALETVMTEPETRTGRSFPASCQKCGRPISLPWRDRHMAMRKRFCGDCKPTEAEAGHDEHRR
jgi:hypothetical protein